MAHIENGTIIIDESCNNLYCDILTYRVNAVKKTKDGENRYLLSPPGSNGLWFTESSIEEKNLTIVLNDSYLTEIDEKIGNVRIRIIRLRDHSNVRLYIKEENDILTEVYIMR